MQEFGNENRKRVLTALILAVFVGTLLFFGFRTVWKDEGIFKKREKTGEETSVSLAEEETADYLYTALLEFSVNTADYGEKGRFSGNMLADITYLDYAGETRTLGDLDIVGLMYEYAGKTPGESGGLTAAAESRIFEKGGTNRFLLSVPELKTLLSVRLKPASGTGGVYRTSGLFVRLLGDEGTVSKNAFGEYERAYEKTPDNLCTTTLDASEISEIVMEAGEQGSLTLYFDEGNEILYDPVTGEISAVEGLRPGGEDTVTLTVTLKNSADIHAEETLSAEILYKTVFGTEKTVYTRLSYDNMSGKFILSEELSAPDIGMPAMVTLTGTTELYGKEVESAVIDKIRDGKQLCSFRFTPEGNAALKNGARKKLKFDSCVSGDEGDADAVFGETLFLELGDLTKETYLSAEKDLLVALYFTKDGDPYGTEYLSEYVSVYESGYTHLKKGDILILSFDTGDISRIGGISLKVTSEDMKVNAERGCISLETENTETGTIISSGWVNLKEATPGLKLTPVRLDSEGFGLRMALYTVGRLSPLYVRLSSDAGNDESIMLTMHLTDSSGEEKDVIQERTAKEFRSGVWVLCEGILTPEYYTLEAQDASGTICVSEEEFAWYSSAGIYKSVHSEKEIKFGRKDSVSYAVGEIRFTGGVIMPDSTGGADLQNNMYEYGRTEYETITVSGEKILTVYAELSGLDDELNVSFVNAENGYAMATADAGTASASGVFDSEIMRHLKIPENLSGRTVTYELRVYAAKIPEECTAVIRIKALPVKDNEEENSEEAEEAGKEPGETEETEESTKAKASENAASEGRNEEPGKTETESTVSPEKESTDETESSPETEAPSESEEESLVPEESPSKSA